MRFLFAFIFVLLGCGASVPGFAQDIHQYVKQSPVPSWVKTYDIPAYDADSLSDRDSYYEIVEWQNRIDADSADYFSRYAEVLLSPQGVEDNANIEVNFDPSYQSVELHYVRVRRDGVMIDKTNLDEFSIYRKETDRDKLLYNGTLEMSYIVPDIRAGDMLEYAVTIKGKNPALGPHYALSYRQQFNDVVQRFIQRVLISESLPVFTKSHVGGKDPETGQVGKYKEHVWDLANPVAITTDEGQPDWIYRYPGYQLSSFESWAEVGQYFDSLYIVENKLPQDLETVRQTILSDYQSDKERTRAALSFVQENIRYLGIEIGPGGYDPRPVKKVMERRFGDCKDMTLLLVTLLRAMDIDASPLLVNSEERGGIADDLPSHRSFDHVVVRAVIGEDVYILDPTRGAQLGDLDHLQQGFFERGVVIGPNSPGMIDADIPLPEFFEDFKETYDLISQAPKILMKSTSTYYAGTADSMLSWHKSIGISEVETEFLKYYQDNYPSIKQAGVMTIDVDEDTGRISFTVNYILKEAWTYNEEDNANNFSIYASETDANIPDFEGADRTSPFAISHPQRSRQVLELKVDDSWYFEDDIIAYDNAAFNFKKVNTFENLVYRQTYEYLTKQDHIPANDFKSVMKDLSAIDDELGVMLEDSVGTQSLFGDMAGEDWWGVFAIVIILAALISLIFVIFLPKESPDILKQQIFHPVALPKFFILSILSLGFYQYFWVYKNWRWVLKAQEDKVVPVLRTLFMPIMNFSLFPRMAKFEGKGYGWFKTAAIPIALAYFIASAVGYMDETSIWILIAYVVPVLLMFLVAVQVLKLNEDNPSAIDRNSQFEWPAILFIILWSPIFLTALVALEVVLKEI